MGGYDDVFVRTPEGWRVSNRRTVQYGTGLGVGLANEPIRSVLEGALGRLPDWP